MIHRSRLNTWPRRRFELCEPRVHINPKAAAMLRIQEANSYIDCDSRNLKSAGHGFESDCVLAVLIAMTSTGLLAFGLLGL